MLQSNLFTALLVTILILAFAEENEVDAAPEPCLELFGFPIIGKHKKSKDDEKQKEKKRRKKKESLNLIEKFLQELFTFK